METLSVEKVMTKAKSREKKGDLAEAVVTEMIDGGIDEGRNAHLFMKQNFDLDFALRMIMICNDPRNRIFAALAT